MTILPHGCVLIRWKLLSACTCNEGQRRCIGDGDTCCNWYLYGACVSSCPMGMEGDPM